MPLFPVILHRIHPVSQNLEIAVMHKLLYVSITCVLWTNSQLMNQRHEFMIFALPALSARNNGRTKTVLAEQK